MSVMAYELFKEPRDERGRIARRLALDKKASIKTALTRIDYLLGDMLSSRICS